MNKVVWKAGQSFAITAALLRRLRTGKREMDVLLSRAIGLADLGMKVGAKGERKEVEIVLAGIEEIMERWVRRLGGIYLTQNLFYLKEHCRLAEEEVKLEDAYSYAAAFVVAYKELERRREAVKHLSGFRLISDTLASVGAELEKIRLLLLGAGEEIENGFSVHLFRIAEEADGDMFANSMGICKSYPLLIRAPSFLYIGIAHLMALILGEKGETITEESIRMAGKLIASEEFVKKLEEGDVIGWEEAKRLIVNKAES